MSKKRVQSLQSSLRRQKQSYEARLKQDKIKRKIEREREASKKQDGVNLLVQKGSLVATSFAYAKLENKGKIPTLGGMEAGVLVGALSFVGSAYLGYREIKKGGSGSRQDTVMSTARNTLDGVTDAMIGISAYKFGKGSLKLPSVGEEIGALPSETHVAGAPYIAGTPYVGDVLSDLAQSNSFVGADSDDEENGDEPPMGSSHETANINY